MVHHFLSAVEAHPFTPKGVLVSGALLRALFEAGKVRLDNDILFKGDVFMFVCDSIPVQVDPRLDDYDYRLPESD